MDAMRAKEWRKDLFSDSVWFRLKREGRGPRTFMIGTIEFITPEAGREWLAQLQAERESEAEQLKAARRRQLAVRAGTAAAASPLHVSKNTDMRKRPRRRA